MRTDPKTTIRLLAAAALSLALGSAGAQQQGQQGGFAPSPNQEPQSPEQPAPEPPREAQPVPFEAELQETLPTDRRIATAGGLIWDCEDDTCRAQGQAPQGQQQTVRLCGDLARRAGEIARMTVGNAVVAAPTLDRCNQAARFAGQVPEPEVPGEQEGGFVPEGADEGLPEGAQTAEGDATLLTVEGEAVRAEVTWPRGGPITESFLPEFSYTLEGLEGETAGGGPLELSEDQTLSGGVLEISEAPFEEDCEVTIDAEHAFTDDPDATYYEGISVSGEPLDMLLGRITYEPYYVRVCPVIYDSSAGVGIRAAPATNTVQIVYGPGPDVEIVSIDKLGPPGRDGLEALYGHAYILEMTLRNNDDRRDAEVMPAYSLNLDAGPFHRARIGVGTLGGSPGSGGAVTLAPGETKDVRVMVDLRPGSVSDEQQDRIHDRGDVLVTFFLAPPDASGPAGIDWYYDDALNANHRGVTVGIDVQRRLEATVHVRSVEFRNDGCDALRDRSDLAMIVTVEHRGAERQARADHVDFSGGIYRAGKALGVEDARAGWPVHATVEFIGSRGSDPVVGIGPVEFAWEEWRDDARLVVGNRGSDGCAFDTVDVLFDVTSRVLPIE